MEFLKGRDLNPIGILTGTEPAEKARWMIMGIKKRSMEAEEMGFKGQMEEFALDRRRAGPFTEAGGEKEEVIV